MRPIPNILLATSLLVPALAGAADYRVASHERTRLVPADTQYATIDKESGDLALVYDANTGQPRRVDARELSAKGRTQQLSFAIVYLPSERDLIIYGADDEENSATVKLVASIHAPLAVRVKLSSGGVATGQSMTVDYPLYTGAGTTLAGELPVGPLEPWETWQPEEPSELPLIDEIFYLGGSDVDHFDNQTDIPSYANGKDGDDVLLGGSSVDHLVGGDGDDELRGREGNDELEATYGNNELYGGDDDDYLHVTANANVNETNKLCGGDGADHLVGHDFSVNVLDSELAGGFSDGHVDTLEGFHDGLESTSYEYTPDQDVLIENGTELDPDGWGLPGSDFITCG